MGISINLGGGNHHHRHGRNFGRRRRPATPLGTMIGGIIVVLFGGGFYYVDQVSAERTAAILEQGTTTEAEVTNRTQEQRTRTDSEGRRRTSTDHYVWLRYTDENGQEQTLERHPVNSRIYNASQGTIKIAYDPSNPGSIAFPDHESGEANPWIGLIIGIIGLLLAGFGFFQFQRQRSQARGGAEDEQRHDDLREQDESQEI